MPDKTGKGQDTVQVTSAFCPITNTCKAGVCAPAMLVQYPGPYIECHAQEHRISLRQHSHTLDKT
eukprot:1280115-Ditylum_brightwellii.AAC.1